VNSNNVSHEPDNSNEQNPDKSTKSVAEPPPLAGIKSPESEVAIDSVDTESPYEPTASKEDVIMIPRAVFNYAVIAIVFFVLGGLMGRLTVAPASTVDTDDIEVVVRDAVADIFEAAGIDTTRSPQDGERYEIAFVNDDDPYLGNPDAPITIVEFSDFLCGFCGRFANETLPLLMDEFGDQIRFVYMDFPVINPNASPVIALAAECADDQGKFWEYHDVLFAGSGQISGPEALYAIADDLELDIEQFQTCFEEGTHMDEINEDSAYARELGLRGTPGFFVNGRFVNGAIPIETFRQIINEELARINS
jgi:protein-disulfide isomerase